MRLDQNISARQTAFARFTYKKRDVQNAPTGSVNRGTPRWRPRSIPASQWRITS